ncbi:hypothetical protein [uncultured Draconibacterium sp.]
MKTTTENIFDLFDSASLSNNEMNQVRGGVEPPRSRDKDVYDFEEE